MNVQNKKRICHVISGLGTGGAERSLLNLLQTDVGTQYQHQVISLKSEGTIGPRIKDLPVPVFSLIDGEGRKKPIGLYQHIRDFNPDLIQGWMYHGNMAAWFLGRALSKHPPVCWNIRHCIYDLRAEKRGTRAIINLSRYVAKSPASIVFNSHLARDQHVALGYAREKTTVIPNGFNTELFHPDRSRRAATRSKLTLPADAFVVGHVGRFHPMKGHSIFLQAIVPFMEAHENVQAVMLGSDVEWETSTLVSQIPGHLHARFHLLGDQSDVASYMNCFDIFVQSASSEAFPNVLGEAMSSGLPCITTAAGDSERVIGNAGWCVAIGDHSAINQTLEQAYSQPAERLACGLAAHDRIKAYYGRETLERSYLDLYSKILTVKG